MDYVVSSYHINVGPGDSAIHVLAGRDNNGQRTLLHAVLIDGGKRFAGPSNLFRVIEKLQQDFACPGGRFRFDSIVVTHWDSDHYGGVITLLANDIGAQMGPNVDPTKIMCRYMKYHDAAADPPGTYSNCLTTFYAPHWEESDSPIGGKKRHPSLVRAGTPGQYTVGINIFKAFSKNGNGGGQVLLAQLCRLCTVPQEYIGRELFTGTVLPRQPYANPTEMRKAYQDAILSVDPDNFYRAAPGLFILAGDAICIGTDGNPVNSGFVHSPSNRSSIACIILDANADPLHYFSGDAECDVDRTLAAWINPIPGSLVMPLMKLSHHGSSYNTPIELIKALNPANVVLSAGTQYGHPRWETILTLAAFYKARGLEYDQQGAAVHATCWPHWLAFKTVNGQEIPIIDTMNIEAFLKPAVYKAFRGAVQELSDTLYQWFFGPPSNTVPALRQWTTNSCSYLLQQLSALEKGYSAFGSKQVVGLNQRSNYFRHNPQDGQIEYFYAHWLSGESEMGYKRTGNDNETPHQPLDEWSDISISITPIGDVNNEESGMLEEYSTEYNAWLRQEEENKSERDENEDALDALLTTYDDLQAALEACYGTTVSAVPGGVAAAEAEPEGGHLFAEEDDVPNEGEAEEEPAHGGFTFLALVQPPPLLPPTGEPGVHTPHLPSDSITAWYYTPHSRVSTTSIPASSQVHAAAENSPLDLFLCSLPGQSLGLVSAPTAGKQTALLDSDPISCWLRTSAFAAKTVYAVGNGDNISQLGSVLDLVPSSSSSAKWGLSFSTTFDNVVTELGVSSVLIMGLDPESTTAPEKTNLATVAEVFQFGKKPVAAGGVGDGYDVYGLVAELFELKLETGANVRNALWLSPGLRCTTFLRLQFQMTPDGTGAVQKFLQNFVDSLTIPEPPRIIAKKKVTRAQTAKEGTITSRVDPEMILQCDIVTHSSSFTTILKFGQGFAQIRLQWNNSPGSLSIGDLLGLLESAIKVPGLKLPQISAWLPLWTDDIKLREVVLTVTGGTTTGSGGFKISGFRIDFEAPANFLNSNEHKDEQVTFLLGYRWPGNIFQAELLTPISSPDPPVGDPALSGKGLFPQYEKYKDLPIVSLVNGKTLATSVPLLKLVPGVTIEQPPDGIVLDVTEIDLELSADYISFSGKIKCDVDAFKNAKQNVPPIAAAKVSVYAQCFHANKTFTLRLETRTALHPKQDAVSTTGGPFQVSVLDGWFEYDSVDKWTFSASAEDVNFAALYSLMDPTCSDSIMNLLQEITIESLFLYYKYGGKAPTSFACGGVLALGELEFDLDYTYDDKGWNFKAGIGATSPNSSVKSMIKSIAPSIVDMIPDFLDLTLQPLQPGAPPEGLEIVQIRGDSGGLGALVFKLSIGIEEGGGILTFYQIQYHAPTTAGAKPPPPKRVVAFSVNRFPQLPTIPLAGDGIKLPFDEMDIIWVHLEPEDPAAGLTRKDLQLLGPDQPLRYKDPSSSQKSAAGASPSTSNDSEVVITTGFHFMAVDGGTVVLDYQFGHKADTPPTPDSPEGKPSSDTPATPSTVTKPSTLQQQNLGGDPATAPLQKTLGPLTISNVALGLKNNSIISLSLNATCKLGPVEFELLGFSISFNMAKAKLNKLSTLIPDISLDGLAASFDKPPLELAGIFEHKGATFSGGMIVGLPPYTLMALGSYADIFLSANGRVVAAATVQPAGGSTVHSLFVFAQLNGPLAELEFAEITGVKLGFGYNSRLVNPTVNSIYQFPLIADLAAGANASDPLSVLTSFCEPANGNAWVINEPDNYWIAVGFTVIAFELLKVTAAVVLEFNPTLVLNIFADAVAAMPKGDPNESFVYVELGIIASFDFEKGTLQVDGQLSPNSFILAPACRLSGGFALYSWFPGSPYAGDWVYSVGGYHPSYQPPSYYPKPARLEISFNIDSDISITGEAYFALTPKACMGGAHLSAVVTCGSVNAGFSAWADFLINFNPFYFTGLVGVSIDLSYIKHVWFVTIDISFDLSAVLEIEGPPFSGILHINFFLFGFSCHFGAGASRPGPLGWTQFVKLLNQSPTNAPDTDKPQLNHLLESGAVTSKGAVNTKGGTGSGPWIVRAGSFKCRVQSKVAFGAASYGRLPAIEFPNSISIKPMHQNSIVSTMAVTITAQGGETDLGETPEFQLEPVTSNLPTSIWGEYLSSEDPALSGNSISTLLSGENATIELVTAVRLLPLIATFDHIPPKVFNAAQAMKQSVYGDDYTAKTPTVPASPQPTFQPVSSPELAWSNAKTAWGLGDLAGLVEAWEGAFKWESKEEANVPAVAIGKFDDIYMAAPRVMAVAG